MSMKPFVIDLETGPRPDATDFLPPVEAPINFKDPEKIRAYIEERRAKQFAEAALSAATARILCVGTLRDGGEPQFIGDYDEGKLLRKTWLELERRGADEVYVTFNGTRFDWPIMCRRSYALGVPVPPWVQRDGRWSPRSHCDLLTLWQLGDRQETISLDRLARLVGLPGKAGNGAQFAALWLQNRPAALEYLANDLLLTRLCFDRMTLYGWPPTVRDFFTEEPISNPQPDQPPLSSQMLHGSPK